MRKNAIWLIANTKVASRSAVLLMAAVVFSACNSSGNKNATSDALDLSGQPTATQEQNVAAADLRAFCPKAIVRGGTETLRIYETGAKRENPDAPQTVRFQATITEVVRECNYVGDMLNVRVGVKGRVINGPTAATGSVELPVRIAATNAKKEVPYTNLNKIPVTIQPGGNYASFSFIENSISVLKPKNNDLVIYVGFDEGPVENKTQ